VGYTTEFEGKFTLDEPLTAEQVALLEKHNEERHDKPSHYCQWAPSEDGKAISWDGGEKFYEYVEWLRVIITQFLKPWGRKLNGVVRWRGEDFDDLGKITVVDNVVTAQRGW
jgi:hypothetical protein